MIVSFKPSYVVVARMIQWTWLIARPYAVNSQHNWQPRISQTLTSKVVAFNSIKKREAVATQVHKQMSPKTKGNEGDSPSKQGWTTYEQTQWKRKMIIQDRTQTTVSELFHQKNEFHEHFQPRVSPKATATRCTIWRMISGKDWVAPDWNKALVNRFVQQITQFQDYHQL